MEEEQKERLNGERKRGRESKRDEDQILEEIGRKRKRE